MTNVGHENDITKILCDILKCEILCISVIMTIIQQ